MQIHAPEDLFRAFDHFENAAHETDQWRSGERDDKVETLHEQCFTHGLGVIAEIVAHAVQSGFATKGRDLHPVHVNPVMYFIGRQLGGAGAILAETTQNMAFVALGSQTFSQVSEVLRGGCVVGPIVLIDEQNPVRLGA